ncbi:acetate kinase [Brachybacterium sp. EF45031]|uniref:acetate/propionate family kinase n=1 Tax=Brachybacterium sillae TaxID=2810536 RepID=UPI00217E20D8|nr:acetate kinase [Brachybacterium sillae]MCS6711361.1 acetate kinase [Brachybacterium sillae]
MSAASIVLVLNSGSSSLKFQLLDPTDGAVRARGIVERIGQERASAKIAAGDDEHRWEGAAADHVAAMGVVQELLTQVGLSLTDGSVRAVGHRVVQGGSRFSEATPIDDAVRDAIRELGELAPLHNYAAVDGIDAARALLPQVPHVAVFDTAFFTDLPAAAHTYAIDREVAAEHAIRRYGAHGTSHRFVSEATAQLLAAQGRDVSDLRQIVLHLGNGASASAVRGGRPVDTSMGLTPLEGLVMGTRSGDIDPSVYVHLSRRAGMSPDEVDQLLNKRSGMLGLCGMSDFRDVSEAIAAGDEAATLAMEVYIHRLRKYLGAYTFVLGGLDALTFTAGIGENDDEVRERLLTGLEDLGIVLDREANARRSGEARIISAPESRVVVLVVPTNEELAIARQAVEVIGA